MGVTDLAGRSLRSKNSTLPETRRGCYLQPLHAHDRREDAKVQQRLSETDIG